MTAAVSIEPDIDLARRLFDQLAATTADAPGVTRKSYGSGEEAAHGFAAATGEALALEVTRDFAGNTYVTLPGRDRGAPIVLIGSHMDSVPHGGNFDGAAGVVCGLSTLAGLQRQGFRPAQDITVMAIRAEESCWFPHSYIGSKMALGRLASGLVDELRRSDTGRTLAEHMTELGYDPGPVRSARPHLGPGRVACYLEPHIEQGPVLDAAGLPVGIVEAITGGPRYREGRIYGVHDHAGGAPRAFRHDAVVALGELITGVGQIWTDLERAGHYSLFTFGIVGTDPVMHGFSRVPGEARFCLDTRGIRPETLDEIRTRLQRLTGEIAARHGVRFEMGADSGPSIAAMDPAIRRQLCAIAERRGIAFNQMPSGAGHDAAAFAGAGVRSAMIFIRNKNGSHNAQEQMALDDFARAAEILTELVVAPGVA